MIKLTVKTHGEEAEQKTYNYEFDQPLITIGRLKENDIPLPLSTVSGYHAQIVADGGNYYIQDRSSINGTFLNRQKLNPAEKKLLQDGDTIRIETFDIYFTVGVAMMNADQGATVQVARQMVMELLGSWESQQEPALILMGGPENGKKIPLVEGKTLVIGRAAGCDIMIEHPTISRKHAELPFSWNGAFIKDLDSPNGVYVNDLRITGTARLRDRDEIRLGQVNSPEAVRLVFSNPAEALLSKIEQAQSTDSNVSEAVQDSAPVQEAAVYAPPPEPAPPTAEKAPEPPSSSATSTAADQPAVPSPVPEVVTRKSPAGIIVILLLLLSIAAGATYYFLYVRPPAKQTLEAQARPNKAQPGDSIQIDLGKSQSSKIKGVTIAGKNMPILSREESTLKVKIPAFQDEGIGEKKLKLAMESEDGTIIEIPFSLLILPEIASLEPQSGKPGTEVSMTIKGDPQSVQVYFGEYLVPVESSSGDTIVVKVPQPSDVTLDQEVMLPVVLKEKQLSSERGLTFRLLPSPFVRKISPDNGNVGVEVNIEMGGTTATDAEVFFGSNQCVVKSASDQKITVVVPAPAESIPAEGLKLPVIVKFGGNEISSKSTFTISREPEKPVAIFELSFRAEPYAMSLGFNEYAITTDIGTFLVLVDKDQYGSSKERAEAVAKTLNSGVIFYKQNPGAKVTAERDSGAISLFAEGTVPEERILLLHAFPSDALAYGKISQNIVSVDSLAEWWRMLIDSYLKVFVQGQSPAPSGILSAGGTILQQVLSFYSQKNEQGKHFYPRDFLNSLPADQKNRLISLSFALPRKIASVDGKWSGPMTNVLYSTIPDDKLEITLSVRQQDGVISGTADLSWKIGMGNNKGGFQNAAFKKLGSFSIKGTFQKTKAFPLEFSFREKDSHLLKFVGKLEGDSLTGSFVDSTSGKEGVWNARLQ